MNILLLTVTAIGQILITEGHQVNISYIISQYEDYLNITRYLDIKYYFRDIKDQQCRKQIIRFAEDLEQNAPWALKMFGASSTYPLGILHGNNYQFGDFDECLSTHSPDGQIEGKYCLVDVQIQPDENEHSSLYLQHQKNDFTLEDNPYGSFLEKFRISKDSSKKTRNIIHNGICIPRMCSTDHIQNGIKSIVREIGSKYGYNMNVTFKPKSCSIPETEKYGTEWKIIWGILILSCKIVLISTVWDFFKSEKAGDSTLELLAQSFSLKNNLIRLTSSSNNELNVLHGMKTLSMMLIILGHRCLASFGGPVLNTEFLEKGYRSFPTIFLLSGILIVDTFFLIGGFLNFIALHQQQKTGKNITIFKVYLYRWLRITPNYMFMVFFYAYVLENLGNGPVWASKVGWEAEKCRKNWWTNFLYINNYVNTNHMCMFQSWYIACDMHYIILSPLIVKLVSKLGEKGFILFIIGIIASSINVSVITFVNKYDGVMKIYYDTLQDITSNPFFTEMYVKSSNRITPYLFGMAAGYIYIGYKDTNVKFSRITIWGCSIISLMFGLSSICVAWFFYIPGREYSALENALYASLHRIFWSFSIGWIIIGCALKSFGRIQPILTANVFIPFSKLCFGVFLVHGAVQIYTTASLRVPEYMSYQKLFWMAGGDILLSFTFALLLHLLLEAPIKGMQHILLNNKKILN